MMMFVIRAAKSKANEKTVHTAKLQSRVSNFPISPPATGEQNRDVWKTYVCPPLCECLCVFNKHFKNIIALPAAFAGRPLIGEKNKRRPHTTPTNNPRSNKTGSVLATLQEKTVRGKQGGKCEERSPNSTHIALSVANREIAWCA